MLGKILVFEFNERNSEFVRNDVAFGKAPLAVRGDSGPQHLAVTVQDDGTVNIVRKQLAWQAEQVPYQKYGTCNC